jgi:SAM-dependent methyltransferase
MNRMNVWDSIFSSGEPIWGFDPSDSAIEAVNIFKANNVKRVLIPGIGYGRNAGLFINNGFDVTGIEISGSAIDIARSHGINCKIHHGSVTLMPFDDEIYDGIYCYALIHLLDAGERQKFLKDCFNQLSDKGTMIFVATSVKNSLYGTGRDLGGNSFEQSPGLRVFFYEDQTIENEYRPYGLIRYNEIEEPVKFMADQPPLKLYYICCRKQIMNIPMESKLF